MFVEIAGTDKACQLAAVIPVEAQLLRELITLDVLLTVEQVEVSAVGIEIFIALVGAESCDAGQFERGRKGVVDGKGSSSIMAFDAQGRLLRSSRQR